MLWGQCDDAILIAALLGHMRDDSAGRARSQSNGLASNSVLGRGLFVHALCADFVSPNSGIATLRPELNGRAFGRWVQVPSKGSIHKDAKSRVERKMEKAGSSA